MADAIAVFPPGYRITDSNDDPVSGGSLEFYTENLAAALTVFSDVDLSASLGSTVYLSSAGVPVSAQGGSTEVQIYTGDSDFGLIIKDSDGATLRSYSSIRGADDISALSSSTALPNTPVIQKSSDYTIVDGDQGKVIDADATGGSLTLTLPSAVTVGDNWRITVKATGTGSGTVTVAPAGAQTLDGSTSGFVLSYQYEAITVVSDGANWHISESARYHQQPFSVTPQGRLTVTTATPVVTSNSASQTSIYYTPYSGNLLPFYDGQRFEAELFNELTLTLVSNHSASTIYDVFAFKDGTTQRIGTGPAWATSTAGSGARGTGAGTTELERVGGLLTNKVSMTARNGTSTYTVAANKGTYLGSILIDGTQGQVTCNIGGGQSRAWGVWNAYNRVPIVMIVVDATASWSYGTGTIRPSNNNTANSCTVFQGLSEEFIDAQFTQRAKENDAASGINAQIGIGVDSTTTISGFGPEFSVDNASSSSIWNIGVGKLLKTPFLGASVLTCLENASSGNSVTFYGTEEQFQMTVQYKG